MKFLPAMLAVVIAVSCSAMDYGDELAVYPDLKVSGRVAGVGEDGNVLLVGIRVVLAAYEGDIVQVSDTVYTDMKGEYNAELQFVSPRQRFTLEAQDVKDGKWSSCHMDISMAYLGNSYDYTTNEYALSSCDLLLYPANK